MINATETFLLRPSTWSLKTCQISTVGCCRVNYFVCLSCCEFFVCMSLCLYDNGKRYKVVGCYWFQSDFIMLMSISWLHSVNVSTFLSICWFRYVDVTQFMKLYVVEQPWHCTRLLRHLKVWKNNSTILARDSTWSHKTCHITTAGSANNGRHYRVVSHTGLDILSWHY